MAAATVAASSSMAAYDIFVRRAISSIAKEVEWGRSKEARELREACQHFLASQDVGSAAEAAPAAPNTLGLAVLPPLQLACASSNARVVEAALGCLHKLVAHAWLQGESNASGEGDGLIEDDADVVARVIRLVIKCGEQQALVGSSSPGSNSSAQPALQLSIIRALLTFTTAEHFVVHGDSLMSAVRTVFNLALSSTDENIKRTACNALLQMLNTVAKRVTVFHAHSVGYSQQGSRRVSDHADGGASSNGMGGNPRVGAPAADAAHSSSSSSSAAELAATSPPAATSLSAWHHHKEMGAPSLHHHTHLETLPEEDAAGSAGQLSEGSAAQDSSADDRDANNARMAQFASLAEQQDLRGLEAAIGGAAAPTGGAQHLGVQLGAATSSREHDVQPELPFSPSTHAANGHAMPHPTSPTAPPRAPSPSTELAARAAPPAPITVPSRPPAQAFTIGGALQQPLPSVAQLSVAERDVLLVLTAFCKLASREAGVTGAETYLHQACGLIMGCSCLPACLPKKVCTPASQRLKERPRFHGVGACC